MKIEILERYGLPKSLVARWHQEGLRTLLPVQIEAVSRYNLLSGKSLIISGPGTSGKTFCGELAAAAKAANKNKAIFLVPLKAIADEKYRIFERRYGPLGLKIRLATRDHAAHDYDISRRNFDIAIMIYEKLNCLTAVDISIIRNTSCFVFDEFQIIGDGKRGIELELIIQKIRRFNPSAQMIVLVGSGSSPDRIARWLDLPVLAERRRPVELRLGVLHRGTFRFRGYNDLNEGDEHWLPEIENRDDDPINSQNMAAIKLLAGQGEQILIFTSTRKNTVRLADYLATNLDLSPARVAFLALSEGPTSMQSESLGHCLNRGVAFHHAELDEHQRQVVEDGFRKGEIRILVSTSTLAWGVNLPAKNVFIETMKYSGQRSANSGMMIEPMTNVDFQQAAGRAGRLGTKQTFGRAIMTAETPYEQEILWDKYIYSSNEDPVSAMTESDLPDLILRLVSSGVAVRPDEIDQSCARLYGSFDTVLSENLPARVNEALVFLESGGLAIIRNGGRIETTSLGRACCAAAISAQTAIEIHEKAADRNFGSLYEWLFMALGTREWNDNSSGYYCPVSMAGALSERLNGVPKEDEVWPQALISANRNLNNAAERSLILAFHFALDWCSPILTAELEKTYDKGAGGLHKDGQTLSWIISAVERIARIFNSGSPGGRPESDLARFAWRLHYGVNDTMLPLAMALDLDRDFIRRIYESGLVSVEHVIEADSGSLSGIVPKSIVLKIERWRKKMLEEKKNYPDTSRSATAASPQNPAGIPSGNMNDGLPQILFTGKGQKQKMEIQVGGQSIYLQPRLYAYLQKLWWAHKSSSPFVFKDALDAGDNQAKYISKLRLLLAGTGIDIVSNGRGSYSLSLIKK